MITYTVKTTRGKIVAEIDNSDDAGSQIFQGYTDVVMESPTTGIQHVKLPTDTLKSVLEIYKEHGFKILSKEKVA